MSDPAIRAALDAACATDVFWQGGDGPADADVMRDRTAAISAFLRHRAAALAAEDRPGLATLLHQYADDVEDAASDA